MSFSRRLPRRTHNNNPYTPSYIFLRPTPDEFNLRYPSHYTQQHRHHAPHLLYAPVARSHRLADPEPASILVHHQDWQALRQGQHWYAISRSLSSALQHGLIAISTGHNFRKSVHPGAFGPDLAKKLSQLVKMEKNVMRSMELVGRERMEVAVSLKYSLNSRNTADKMYSNNSLSGARASMTTFPMLPTSSVCSSTRSVSSRTSSSTVTTSTV
jgi:hypothetical protein